MIQTCTKGLEVGAYDLISWTREVPDKKWAIINNQTFGACLASSWYDYIFDKFKKNLLKINLTAIETDGPYEGYSCASKKHKYHKDITDSVYQQSKMQTKLYLDLHKLGFYINQPDDYFFYGANKNGTGTAKKYSLG